MFSQVTGACVASSVCCAMRATQHLAVFRSLSVALDGSMVVAANNAGTAYVWRMLRGASLTTHFEPLHKLRAHQGE
jgi:target of rapamycin complex subunit LST8